MPKRWSGVRFTDAERAIAERYKQVGPFLEYDLQNCLIHSRILLDRVVGLSRHFLRQKNVPSFTSFNEHKRFFKRLKTSWEPHEEYAEYFRANTDWFEMPLKSVRDKFIVHASPQHMRFLAYPNDHELQLVILIPDGEDRSRPLQRVKMIQVGAVQLSLEVERFLVWYSSYGLKAV